MHFFFCIVIIFFYTFSYSNEIVKDTVDKKNNIDSIIINIKKKTFRNKNLEPKSRPIEINITDKHTNSKIDNCNCFKIDSTKLKKLNYDSLKNVFVDTIMFIGSSSVVFIECKDYQMSFFQLKDKNSKKVNIKIDKGYLLNSDTTSTGKKEIIFNKHISSESLYNKYSFNKHPIFLNDWTRLNIYKSGVFRNNNSYLSSSISNGTSPIFSSYSVDDLSVFSFYHLQKIGDNSSGLISLYSKNVIDNINFDNLTLDATQFESLSSFYSIKTSNLENKKNKVSIYGSNVYSEIYLKQKIKKINFLTNFRHSLLNNNFIEKNNLTLSKTPLFMDLFLKTDFKINKNKIELWAMTSKSNQQNNSIKNSDIKQIINKGNTLKFNYIYNLDQGNIKASFFYDNSSMENYYHSNTENSIIDKKINRTKYGVSTNFVYKLNKNYYINGEIKSYNINIDNGENNINISDSKLSKTSFFYTKFGFITNGLKNFILNGNLAYNYSSLINKGYADHSLKIKANFDKTKEIIFGYSSKKKLVPLNLLLYLNTINQNNLSLNYMNMLNVFFKINIENYVDWFASISVYSRNYSDIPISINNKFISLSNYSNNFKLEHYPDNDDFDNFGINIDIEKRNVGSLDFIFNLSYNSSSYDFKGFLKENKSKFNNEINTNFLVKKNTRLNKNTSISNFFYFSYSKGLRNNFNFYTNKSETSKSFFLDQTEGYIYTFPDVYNIGINNRLSLIKKKINHFLEINIENLLNRNIIYNSVIKNENEIFNYKTGGIIFDVSYKIEF